MYARLFSLLFVRMSAERAHQLGFRWIRLAYGVPGLGALLHRLLAPRDPVLRVSALGRDFPGPLGLAAGFDKDALGPDALAALGFGFVEIGTVTGQAQPGNPPPRLFRLIHDRALINRMGFNNHGASAAASRLADRRRSATSGGALVGVNIGKTKVVSEDDAVHDYVLSTRALALVADYLVVNVSSPNTPGLRNLQEVSRLRPLLRAVRATLDEVADGAGAARVPLLVKIAPDLADGDIDEIADLAVELGLDGMIATNTTIARTGLTTPAEQVEAIGAGGLSGAPLKTRSLEVLSRLYARVGDRLTLVGVGGIESADDAWDLIAAGATLVQGYSGFIYGGPLWPARIHRGLAERARAAGLDTIQGAVGTAAAGR
jgi:dihydroorotate dehydrogenase